MPFSDAPAIPIRPAHESDAGALAALARRTFSETFAAANDPADLSAFLEATYGPEIQRAELRDPALTYLVAEDGGSLVAYAMLRRGTPLPCITDPSAIELQRFYVASEGHGTGLSQRLMTACIDAARATGATTLFLGVWEHNPRAIRFYEKTGFTTVGEHTFLVGSDEQRDLVLARPI
jgi:diamine N-acetyltransferase